MIKSVSNNVDKYQVVNLRCKSDSQYGLFELVGQWLHVSRSRNGCDYFLPMPRWSRRYIAKGKNTFITIEDCTEEIINQEKIL